MHLKSAVDSCNAPRCTKAWVNRLHQTFDAWTHICDPTKDIIGASTGDCEHVMFFRPLISRLERLARQSDDDAVEAFALCLRILRIWFSWSEVINRSSRQLFKHFYWTNRSDSKGYSQSSSHLASLLLGAGLQLFRMRDALHESSRPQAARISDLFDTAWSLLTGNYWQPSFSCPLTRFMSFLRNLRTRDAARAYHDVRVLLHEKRMPTGIVVMVFEHIEVRATSVMTGSDLMREYQ